MSDAGDDELFVEHNRQRKRLLRWSVLWMGLMLLYIAAVAALAGLADRFGWYARYGIPEWMIYPVMLVPVLARMIYDRLHSDASFAPLPDRIARRHIDALQKRYANFIIGLLVILGFLAIVFTAAIVVHPVDATGHVVMTSLFVAAAVICAAFAVFGPGKPLADEGWNAQQAKITRWSYATAMIVLPAALVIVQLCPAWAALVAIWATFVAAAAPTVIRIVFDKNPYTENTP